MFGKTNEGSVSYTDSDGNVAKIPDGYAVGTSENVNKVTGGLVAQDNEGNQFVWIPVGDIKKSGTTVFTVTLGRYAFAKDQPIPETPVQTQANYSEKILIGPKFQESINQTESNAHAKDLKTFIDNAIIDGGYWFGRYEASNNSGTKSRYDEEAWGNVTQSIASKEARNLKASGTYQSDLVNSYAWDTAIVFIEKSGHAGYASQNSKNTTKLNTGKSRDKVCNIYDISSNCVEWNTETCTASAGPCTARGGNYSNIGSYYASVRSVNNVGTSGSNYSFRTTLYRP